MNRYQHLNVLAVATALALVSTGASAAGRADLCALARPHLADPAWTLHEAAKLQSRQVSWPQPYRSGRDQLYREIFKQKELLPAIK